MSAFGRLLPSVYGRNRPEADDQEWQVALNLMNVDAEF